MNGKRWIALLLCLLLAAALTAPVLADAEPTPEPAPQETVRQQSPGILIATAALAVVAAGVLFWPKKKDGK